MTLVAGIAAVALGLSALLAQAGPPTSDGLSVEYRLAVVERGGYVPADDPLVLAYGNVLDRIQPRCNESRLQLGNIAAALALEVDEESPYSATPLSLLRGLDEAAIPELYGPDHPGNCAELLGVIAFLASQGE